MANIIPNVQNLSFENAETTKMSTQSLNKTSDKTNKLQQKNRIFKFRSDKEKNFERNKVSRKRKFDSIDKEGSEQMEKMARITIEESMSRAVIRKCWLCRNRYIKEGGCNAMKCLCGTTTCYHCGHLMSNNLTTVHLMCPLMNSPEEDNEAIQSAVESTKKQLLQTYPKLTFKYDPSK